MLWNYLTSPNNLLMAILDDIRQHVKVFVISMLPSLG